MCQWLLAFEQGCKVALFLSDISGAFDRVHVERLMLKLQRSGLNTDFLEFIRSYLSTRTGVVIADGKSGAPFALDNMVFQGTVLGPSLWNIC